MISKPIVGNWRPTLALFVLLASLDRAIGGDIVLGDFEGANLDSWTTNGTAFGSVPFRPGTVKAKFVQFTGAGLAWSGASGLEGQGTLLSPPFAVERRYINFLVAGNRDFARRIGVELLVDDRPVRSSSATEMRGDNSLRWRTWDVSDCKGRTARIRINDNADYGAIAADSFTQSDEPKTAPTDATTLYQETYRPQFHFTATAGWMNDANGLVYYQGRWLLSHQHRPPELPVTAIWGHAVSTDLLHWRHQPAALADEGEFAIQSGSGLVDWENASGLKRGADHPLLFFYTLRPPGETAVVDGKGERAVQCMAYSLDGGKTFEKSPTNPILRTNDYRDRDPKVFWHGPTRHWVMVLSLSRNNAHREKATYGLYRSPDLKSWELLQEIGPGAWYWECPDMFEMAVDGDPAKTKWLLVKGSGDYIIGSFDGLKFLPETEPIRTHFGGSFYGAQSWSDAPNGRRIHIGWMSTGKERGPAAYPGMPFNQQMSFPREWTLRTTPVGPRVYRMPVAEIEQLYTKSHNIPPRSLAPGENGLANATAQDLLDIDLQLDLQHATQATINLRGEEIIYDVKEKKLKAFGGAAPLIAKDGKLTLRILLDRTSIEIFANDGEVAHNGIFFPHPDDRSLSLTVQGSPATIKRLTVRELNSIWDSSTK